MFVENDAGVGEVRGAARLDVLHQPRVRVTMHPDSPVKETEHRSAHR